MSGDAHATEQWEEPGRFRARVHAWFDANAPKKGSAEDFSSIHVVSASTAEQYEAGKRRAIDTTRRWQRTLFDAGLTGRSWPPEYGGHGAPQWQDDVVADEQSHYGVSAKMVWTSGAGAADFALLLARIAGDGQRGLAFLILDMSEPGVTVSPLRQMSGAYHFNEVLLVNVFVPEDGLIGGLGAGWDVLRTMLASERAAIGGGTSARSATQLIALARALGRASDAVAGQLVASAVIRERVLDVTVSRVRAWRCPVRRCRHQAPVLGARQAHRRRGDEGPRRSGNRCRR